MSKIMKPQEGGHVPQTRAKVNAPSVMLTAEENETVFKLLGRKCQTLNTAVVQIFKTEGSAHSHWKKKHTGVVCFVKDSAIRSYFLRAYCLIKNELIWEHELYDSMKIVKARPFLLTFEGQDGHVGLNFVSEDECDSFFRAVDTTIETRNRKKLEKRNRPKSQLAPAIPPPVPKDPPTRLPFSFNNASDTRVQMRNHPKIGSVTLTSAVPPTSASSKSFLSSNFGHLSSSNKEKKRKVTKADISTPTNFVHLSHVGWNADRGFDLAGNENDEVLTNFFAKAGVSENELNDRDTRAFIYDFIQSNNVLASVKSEHVESPKTKTAPAPMAPPPVPSRQQHPPSNGVITAQRAAPPPPPARQPPPPVPTTVPGTSRTIAPPTRPPPIHSTTFSSNQSTAISAPTAPPPPPPPPPPLPTTAPPPPPPPASVATDIPVITTTQSPNVTPKAHSSRPVIPDARSALMESIRKGTTLRKVDPASLSTGSGDSRSDLMSEIRMGIELRPAQTRELAAHRVSDEGSGGTDALADALRRALQERVRVIQSSDDESESSGNDDEWDD